MHETLMRAVPKKPTEAEMNEVFDDLEEISGGSKALGSRQMN